MNNTAVDIDSVIEFESNFEHQQDGEIVELDFRNRDSLSEIFNNEIEAWARHALASNGFGDY
jgi:hypothetical protein